MHPVTFTSFSKLFYEDTGVQILGGLDRATHAEFQYTF